jgi:hypothetical protein
MGLQMDKPSHHIEVLNYDYLWFLGKQRLL